MSKKSKDERVTNDGYETLREIAEGASKVLQNAMDLHDEASALHAAGSLGRALFLHQISLEECAKIEMLGAWAVSVLSGMDIDVQRLSIAFASHKAKNHTNAYMLPITNAEADAREKGRWHEASEAFKQLQSEFHRESNTTKNASLYVDFQDGTFVAPKEQISEAMVAHIANANEKFLAGAHAKVRMMTRWVSHSDKARDLMTWFETRLTELRGQTNDPGEAISVIMDEMFARANESGYSQAMTAREHIDEQVIEGS